MGALIEKAENAKEPIIQGCNRLVDDGLINQLSYNEWSELKRAMFRLEKEMNKSV